MVAPLSVVFYQPFEQGWPPRIELGGLRDMGRGCENELDFSSLADISYLTEILAPHRAVEVLLQAGLWSGFACKWCMVVEQFLLGLLSILS